MSPTWVVTARALNRRAQLRWLRARRELKSTLLKYLPSESQYVFGLTLVIGAVCGLIAVGFHLSIRFAEQQLINRALSSDSWVGGIWVVLTPVLGGLVAGAALTYVVPGARGSGIPQVKEAFVLKQGVVPIKDGIGKFFLSVLQIGSGASLGREGPTVHICAAAASAMSRLIALPPKSTRRLMPVGVAAGIAAAFNAPIAAVTFTIEEIVGTLDQTVLSGVVVAAAVAAVIERSVLGVHPIIEVAQTYSLDHASSLPLFALLGVVAGFVSILFTDSLLQLRREFRELKGAPRWTHPAIGGFITGALILVMLRVAHTGGINGGGYETLGKALSGRLDVQVMAALCLIKLLATVASYSSGGSGGIFAPSLFMGAMLGGAIGYLDVFTLGHESTRALGAFALVGMGAMFAGIVRAPITSVLIIFEMTGGYGLVLPLMLANMTSYAIARRFRPVPIYEALLVQDGIHLPQQTRAAALEQLPVESAMSSDVASLTADLTVLEAAERMKGKTFSTSPVLDAERRFTGLVQLIALRNAALFEPTKRVGELATPGETVSVDTPLGVAAARMGSAKVRQLAVLDVTGRLAGILAMSDVLRAHARAADGAIPSQGDSLLATKVSLLAVDATPISRSTGLRELFERLLATKDGALPLQVQGGRYSVVMLDQVRELWRDGNALDALVVAADVAHATPALAPDADVLHALRLMDLEHVDALPLVEGPPGTEAKGVLTRAEVGRFLFAHYARRGGAPQP